MVVARAMMGLHEIDLPQNLTVFRRRETYFLLLSFLPCFHLFEPMCFLIVVLEVNVM